MATKYEKRQDKQIKAALSQFYVEVRLTNKLLRGVTLKEKFILLRQYGNKRNPPQEEKEGALQTG